MKTVIASPVSDRAARFVPATTRLAGSGFELSEDLGRVAGAPSTLHFIPGAIRAGESGEPLRVAAAQTPGERPGDGVGHLVDDGGSPRAANRYGSAEHGCRNDQRLMVLGTLERVDALAGERNLERLLGGHPHAPA